MRYNNIRIPERLRNVFPVVASEYKIENLISKLQGDRLYPLCRIGDGVVKSFSNKTYTYQLDDCYHVRSDDDVVVVETPYNRVSTDGTVIEIENTRSVVQGELKGLCGSTNGDQRKNILTAQACIAQTCQAAALTYRVQDQTC